MLYVAATGENNNAVCSSKCKKKTIFGATNQLVGMNALSSKTFLRPQKTPSPRSIKIICLHRTQHKTRTLLFVFAYCIITVYFYNNSLYIPRQKNGAEHTHGWWMICSKTAHTYLPTGAYAAPTSSGHGATGTRKFKRKRMCAIVCATA